MTADLAAALADLRATADRRGWVDVRAALDRLLDARPTPSLLLAVCAGHDPGPFQTFLRERLPGVSLTTQAVERADEAAVVSADRLAVLLPCVRLLDAGAVEAVAALANARPASERAVVLVGLEALGDEEDAAVVRRGADRLFAGEALWWDAGGAKEFLHERLDADRARLREWLAAPVDPAGRLERGRVLAVVDLAERRSRERAEGAAPARAGRPQALSNARESLLDLRRQLLHWLDAQVSSVERELTASLRALEQDLLSRLQPLLRRWSHEGTPPARRLRDHLAGELQRWRGDALARLRQRGEEIAADGQALLAGADWALVNEVVRPAGMGPYPEALVRELALPLTLAEPEVPTLAGPPERGEAPRLLDVNALVGVGAGGALGAAVFGLVGLAVVGAVVGGAAGVIGGSLLRSRLRGDQGLREAEGYARSVVVEVTSRFVEQVRDEAHRAARPARERLADELRGLESALDAAIDAARRGGPPPSAEESADAKAVARCREAAGV